MYSSLRQLYNKHSSAIISTSLLTVAISITAGTYFLSQSLRESSVTTQSSAYERSLSGNEFETRQGDSNVRPGVRDGDSLQVVRNDDGIGDSDQNIDPNRPLSCGDLCNPNNPSDSCPESTECLNVGLATAPEFRCSHPHGIEISAPGAYCPTSPVNSCGEACVKGPDGSDPCGGDLECVPGPSFREHYGRGYHCLKAYPVGKNPYGPEEGSSVYLCPDSRYVPLSCGEVCESSRTNESGGYDYKLCSNGLECREGPFPGISTCLPPGQRTCP